MLPLSPRRQRDANGGDRRRNSVARLGRPRDGGRASTAAVYGVVPLLTKMSDQATRFRMHSRPVGLEPLPPEVRQLAFDATLIESLRGRSAR